MRSVFVSIAFAALAAAIPQAVPQVPSDISQMTIPQAQSACGKNTRLTCCNQGKKDGKNADNEDGGAQSPAGTTSRGLVADVLNGVLGDNGLLGADGVLGKVADGLLDLELFDTCSELSISALIGVTDILGSTCSGKVACCDSSESKATGGLINLALPCVALGGIIN